MMKSKVLSNFILASQPGNEQRAADLVASAVADLAVPGDAVERLKTAVAEATMNAMEHGNRYQPDQPVAVEVVVSETNSQISDLLVRIRDFGSQKIEEPDAPDLEEKLAGRQPTRGWGRFLMRTMVDEVRDTFDGTVHTVELVLHLREERSK